MAAKPVKIAYVADTSELRSSLKKADAAIESTGNTATRSGSKVGKAFGVIGKAAALGLGAAVVGVAAAGAKFAQAAIEDEKSAARMAQTFRKAAGATKGQVAATESWITAQGKAFGVADDDLRPALSRLVTATGSVAKAQELASLAMDVSAGSGKSLESVSTALMKAQNGQVSALSRLGINTKDAEGKTISMEVATKRMADTFGGAAKSNAGTLGGQIERLKLMASEAGESVGAKMLPRLTEFAGFVLNKGIPAVQGIVSSLAERFGPTVQKIAGFVSEQLVPAIRTLAEKVLAGARAAFDNIKAAMDRNQDTVLNLKAAFSAVWGFIRDSLLPLLGRFYETVLPAIGTAIGKVIDGIKVWMEIFRTLWNVVLQPIIKLILNAFGALLDAWGSLLGALSKVPGFEWAKTAGDKMKAAADQARGLAKNIKDIPPLKKVAVTVAYTYTGLQAGSGPTRGRGDDFLGARVPKLAKGGIVTSPTLALIGEAGPEAVVPLTPHNRPGLGGRTDELLEQILTALLGSHETIGRSIAHESGRGWSEAAQQRRAASLGGRPAPAGG